MRPSRIAECVVLVVLAAAILPGCGGRGVEGPAAPPSELPVGDYREALARGEPVYRIDPDESLLIVKVYRDGPLARLGHDHVVASRDLTGFAVWPDATGAARADILMPLATLDVDDPALRADAGFESEPSAEDIAGTRRNMLASLEANLYPDVLARATLVAPERLSVELRMHGVMQLFELPVELRVTEERLEASGSFTLTQSQFGVTPHAVFGGALSVADRLDVTFRLGATRDVMLTSR